MQDTEFTVIGIIGCGPRGLAALESLYSKAAHKNILPKTIIFEQTLQLGAGPVYDVTQAATNLLNVSERAVDIPPRERVEYKDLIIPGFPTFQSWSGYDEATSDASEVDRFPLRSMVGNYLRARFDSIADALTDQGLLQVVHGEVISACPKNGGIRIRISNGGSYQVDEAVLTIGHQPTEPDEQLSDWLSRAANSDRSKLFEDPYPVKRISAFVGEASPETIVLRGFGLAMIDIVKALTEGMGGCFKITDDATRSMEYQSSGREPKSIIPFSLDGLPAAPKPMNRKLDLPFIPSDDELREFREVLQQAMYGNTVPKTIDFLIRRISPLIAKRYTGPDMLTPVHGHAEQDIQDLVQSWLHNASFTDDLIIPLEWKAKDMMVAFAGMASGQREVSLDYCIGNVWRYCEPSLYETLAFSPLSDSLIVEIVALVERMKRYSYGPPLDSVQQLLALERAGILNLDFVNDPAIELKATGWRMEKSGKVATADVLVNAIMDSPQILKVTSELPKSLIDGSLVEPWEDSLGIRTEKNGLFDFKDKDVAFPLAVLGRLTKGTLVGVDAIEACFGNSSKWWAEGLMDRMANLQELHN